MWEAPLLAQITNPLQLLLLGNFMFLCKSSTGDILSQVTIVIPKPGFENGQVSHPVMLPTTGAYRAYGDLVDPWFVEQKKLSVTGDGNETPPLQILHQALCGLQEGKSSLLKMTAFI